MSWLTETATCSISGRFNSIFLDRLRTSSVNCDKKQKQTNKKQLRFGHYLGKKPKRRTKQLDDRIISWLSDISSVWLGKFPTLPSCVLLLMAAAHLCVYFSSFVIFIRLVLPSVLRVFLFSKHVIWFSDLVDLWVITIKSLWSFAHVVRWDHVNRARNTDHAARTCEKFVYSTVTITRLYDYRTWQTHF